MQTNMLKKIANKLKNAKKVLIFPHVSPDGDAIGSCTALHNALKQIGISSKIFLIDELPARFDFLGEYNCFIREVACEFDMHIALDVADPGRLTTSKELFFSCENNACIDHHGTNQGFAALNHISMEAATGSLIYDLLKEMEIPLTRDIANCIYIALASDTGNFVYTNTDKKSFEIAAKLVEAGAEISKIADLIFRRTSEKTTRVTSAVVSTLQMFNEGKLAIMHTTLDTLAKFEATKEHCDDVINFARDIDTVVVAAFVYEIKDDKFKVSMRGKDGTDVAKVAVSYGGGGHKAAAGFTLSCGLEEAIETVKREFAGI